MLLASSLCWKLLLALNLTERSNMASPSNIIGRFVSKDCHKDSLLMWCTLMSKLDDTNSQKSETEDINNRVGNNQNFATFLNSSVLRHLLNSWCRLRLEHVVCCGYELLFPSFTRILLFVALSPDVFCRVSCRGILRLDRSIFTKTSAKSWLLWPLAMAGLLMMMSVSKLTSNE